MKAFLMLLLASSAMGQDFRALMTGTVTDPSGAAIPNASITAINTGTNAHSTTKSGADGNYVLPQLAPGLYELTVEAAGFQRYTRPSITLSVGDKANIQVKLELGQGTQTVTVNGELSGIEQNQSITGQLMTNKSVSELPLNGRQVFMLLELSAGVVFTTQVFGAAGNSGTRAWDTTGAYSIQGSFNNTNSFVLDGSPLGVNGQWDYSPLADAVEEFKVTSFTNDASQGLTGGGVINMTMKSGTNTMHGLVSEFIRNNIFDAVATQTNQAAAQNPSLAKQPHKFNSYAAMLTGPIIKNKFFYSGNYEGFQERVPFPVTSTIPTALQRVGNFSQTLNAAGALITIYDPLTTRVSGTGYARDAFAGNVIPAARMPAVARNIMSYVPLPNVSGSPGTQFNNYIATPNIGKYGYDSHYLKFDYIWNERHHTFASESYNIGHEDRSQTGLPEGNPARYGPNPNERAHYGSTLDHVWSASPSLVINARVSWDRYYWSREQQTIDKFDGSGLGFKGISGANAVTHFPSLTMTNYVNLGGGVSRMFQGNDLYSGVLDVSKSLGKHFIKFGSRYGTALFSRNDLGNIDGLFAFTPGWTQKNPLTADATSGNAVASFLLGYPNSGSTDVNPGASYSNRFLSMYVQDDFKVSRKLMINLGLRWDVQTPTTERYNRILASFDPTQSYQLGTAKALGGVTFASPDHRQAWNTHYRDYQPRFGIAYEVNRKLVLRSGYGLSFLPLNGPSTGPPDVNQTGFTRSTPFVATTGGGLNSYIPGLPGTGTLETPFPQGILQPLGAAQGPKTSVGQAVTVVNTNFVIPRVQQFNLGLNYELPMKATIEASFVASRTSKYSVSQQIDAISLDQRLKGVADPNYLNASVTNPFAGAPELSGTSFSAATFTQSQALKPFPQFSGVTITGMPVGTSSYNALELRLNKRLSSGFSLTGAYTFSKTLQAIAFREVQYTNPERVISPNDRSQHLSLHALYELPFGRGRQFGKNWNRMVNGVFGNWQYNFILENMTGTPTAMPGATPIRNPQLPDGQQNYDHWFDTCTLLTNGQRSGCSSATAPVTWVQLKPNELITYSASFPNIRNPWAAQVSMSAFKSFSIHERVKMEFRAETFNTFNTPIYAGPDTSITSPTFGVVVRNQENFPRNMQFALRIKF